MKKKYAFRGRKGERKPKNGIWGAIGNFTWSKKKYIFGGQKGDNKPTEPKNKIFGPKISIDGRVIYRSIGNFMSCKKQLSEQKRRFSAPFWVRKSCDRIHRLGILHGVRKYILVGSKR
jgi:hypothetical protein